jgi:hypothetical protein
MRIRDELGELFSDADFAGLYPSRGKPAWSPGRLALISVMQFAEGLSDRQAAPRCAGGWIGSTCWGWSWPIWGSTTRCSRSSGTG